MRIAHVGHVTKSCVVGSTVTCGHSLDYDSEWLQASLECELVTW